MTLAHAHTHDRLGEEEEGRWSEGPQQVVERSVKSERPLLFFDQTGLFSLSHLNPNDFFPQLFLAFLGGKLGFGQSTLLLADLLLKNSS